MVPFHWENVGWFSKESDDSSDPMEIQSDTENSEFNLDTNCLIIKCFQMSASIIIVLPMGGFVIK
jgi:hypothetical protein